MTAGTYLHEIDLAAQSYAGRILWALHEKDVAGHLLDGQHAPDARQVALTLRALADFPLCLRILPLSARWYRSGDRVVGLSQYLAGFADHLAHLDVRTPYIPEYWILGEPVTHRLARLVSLLPTDLNLAEAERPTAQQSAATLLALADVQSLELPRRLVEVAGDGDLPWNGATGIGLFFQQLANHITPARIGSLGTEQDDVPAVTTANDHLPRGAASRG